MSIYTNKQHVQNNMVYATKTNLQNIYTKILSLLGDFVKKRTIVTDQGLIAGTVELETAGNTIYKYTVPLSKLTFLSIEDSDLKTTIIFQTDNTFIINAKDFITDVFLEDDGTIFEPNSFYEITIQNKILSKKKLIILN